MQQHKLVLLEWHSCEREKYVWEDMHVSSWDETIGRVFKLHGSLFDVTKYVGNPTGIATPMTTARRHRSGDPFTGR